MRRGARLSGVGIALSAALVLTIVPAVAMPSGNIGSNGCCQSNQYAYTSMKTIPVTKLVPVTKEIPVEVAVTSYQQVPVEQMVPVTQ